VIAANSPAFVELAARVAEELSFLPHHHERRPQIQVPCDNSVTLL
jgi:hypothetical protein